MTNVNMLKYTENIYIYTCITQGMTHASYISICMQCDKKSNAQVVQAVKPLEVAILIEQVRLGESAQKHALCSNTERFL